MTDVITPESEVPPSVDPLTEVSTAVLPVAEPPIEASTETSQESKRETTQIQINPEVLAITGEVIKRIKELKLNNNRELVAPTAEDREKLIKPETVRHVIPKDDVVSIMAMLRLAKELDKKAANDKNGQSKYDRMLRRGAETISKTSITHIDKRDRKFIVENIIEVKIILVLRVFQLKSHEEAEAKIASARKKLMLAKKQKCKTVEGLEKVLRTLVEAQGKGTRYIKHVICADIKEAEAEGKIAELIASGELQEGDMSIIHKLFDGARLKAKGISDVNIKSKPQVDQFYQVIRTIHHALSKLQLP